MRIVVATRNEGKLREARQILADCGLEVVGGSEVGMGEVEETGSSYEENALLKTRSICGRDLIVIGEDSGLEVAALGGRPGIMSARYGGGIESAARNQLLLDELEGIEDRQAQFVAVYAVCFGGCMLGSWAGECQGEIVVHPMGAGGFGYDPIFRPHGYERTMAELSTEEKSAISHRGKALRKVMEFIREYRNGRR